MHPACHACPDVLSTVHRSRVARARAAAWLAASIALAVQPAPAWGCGEADLGAELRALAAALDARAGAALDRIDGIGRRLLAARSYLRTGAALGERWSWTADEIATYRRSAEYAAMRSELANVTRRFEELNPGHTLYVNLEARSFELQLSRWNTNASVARAADGLLAAALAKRCATSRDAGAFVPNPDLLRSFLVAWRPPALPSLAAPGLSLHGQLRAFDFQVKRGERIVAGPDTSTIRGVWLAEGWKERVRTAVQSASRSFRGPLEVPDEPWHYVYEPER
jgi:hypothetical protein